MTDIPLIIVHQIQTMIVEDCRISRNSLILTKVEISTFVRSFNHDIAVMSSELKYF